ncbi:TPA: aminopeptidase P family protein [Streptococcus suis]|nr:aminopeptidase P family protein [Streptococcus suis]
MQARVEKFEAKLAQSAVEGILVTGQNNIYYLTGFWGTEATVFISGKRRLFVTDSRYTLIAKASVKGFDIIESRFALEEIAKVIKEDGLETIGFDSQVTYGFYQSLTSIFEGYQLAAMSNFIEDLRMIKDAAEIATIQRACQISDQAFIDALDFIKPGKTEIEIANFLDFRMREMGAEGVSFDTIAASGYRSAMPHGRASNKVIEAGEALTLDFGCLYDHYVSDMTRTVYVGSVSDEEREIYETVLAANQALIATAKAGMEYKEFDGVPRRVIEQAGFGPYFTHGIGHGMGLDVHEYPYFSRTATDPIQAGMVLTDEPGIYLEGKYGVRIEDDLLITDTGCKVLTLAPKELIVI